VYVPGVNGNGLTAVDVAFGLNQEFVFRNRLTAWPVAASETLSAKRTTAETFRASFFTDGRIYFSYSLDGSTVLTAFSPVLASAPEWVKITRNGTTGAILFYTATGDGTNTPPTFGAALTTGGTQTPGALHDSTDPVTFGAQQSGLTLPLTGGIHRAIVKNDIDGANLLDVDTSVLTSMTATSFTARTGQTVSIVRSTGATYKTEIVLPGIGSRILNGTSDFGEIPDLAGLDFGASDSGTFLMLACQWPTLASTRTFASKRDNASGAGWTIKGQTATTIRVTISDGSNTVTADATITPGTVSVVGFVIDRTAQLLYAVADGVRGTGVSCAAVGSLANAINMRVGQLGGAGTDYGSFRHYAEMLAPSAMTNTQIATWRTSLLTATAPAAAARTLDLSVPTRTLELTT
jgi:hypothetical protein